MKAVLPLDGYGGRIRRILSVSRWRGRSRQHGITAVIQPGGSVRDEEVIAAADRLVWRWCLRAYGTSGTSVGSFSQRPG